jgi:NADH:ubiquinone oxidoreductase subunit E
VHNTFPEIDVEHKGRGSLLSLLKEAQCRHGYLTEDVMIELARSLDIPLGEVYGVASFYSFLATKPLAENVIRLCKSVPCYLKNNQLILEAVEGALGIKLGGTTKDGKFALQSTNCIGACDQAPAMMIGDTLYVDLTPKKVVEILDGYK